jgi:excisionase family DNA binding protein
VGTDLPLERTPKPASKRGPKNVEQRQSTTNMIRGIRGASSYLSLSERTVWSLVNRNAIPHRRVGRALLFSAMEIEAWVTAGCPTEANAAVRVRKGVA